MQEHEYEYEDLLACQVTLTLPIFPRASLGPLAEKIFRFLLMPIVSRCDLVSLMRSHCISCAALLLTLALSLSLVSQRFRPCRRRCRRCTRTSNTRGLPSAVTVLLYVPVLVAWQGQRKYQARRLQNNQHLARHTASKQDTGYGQVRWGTMDK